MRVVRRAANAGTERWASTERSVSMAAPAGRSSSGTAGSKVEPMPGGREARKPRCAAESELP